MITDPEVWLTHRWKYISLANGNLIQKNTHCEKVNLYADDIILISPYPLINLFQQNEHSVFSFFLHQVH